METLLQIHHDLCVCDIEYWTGFMWGILTGFITGCGVIILANLRAYRKAKKDCTGCGQINGYEYQ